MRQLKNTPNQFVDFAKIRKKRLARANSHSQSNFDRNISLSASALVLMAMCGNEDAFFSTSQLR